MNNGAVYNEWQQGAQTGVLSGAVTELSPKEMSEIIKDLQKENRQLNRKVNLLQKKIDSANIAAQTDKLVDDIRSLEQKKLEKYMKLFLQYSQIVTLMLDEHGRLAYCTNEFLRLAGISNFGFVNGRTLNDVFSIFGNSILGTHAGLRFDEIKKTLKSISVNTKIWFPANPAEHLYTVEMSPITENGVFDGAILTCHDTTELRNEEAEERTRLMLDSTPLACLLWTANGRLIGWNKTTTELLGLNGTEMNAESFFSRCVEVQDDGLESVIKWNNLIKETLEKGSVQTEWNCLINNDEPLPLDATFVRMPWKDRFRVAVYAVDLRELRKREMAVRKANEENRMLELEAKTAEAASKAKSDFLATMSHELRTPMNVIIGMSELIPTDNLNDKQKDFFYEIQNMSKTLLNLINDILDFSKIEAGKLDVILVNYNIRTVLDTVTSMFRFIAEKKHLAFCSYISDDIPDVLYGDETRIRQIFTNIISNAVKYTNSGSIGVTISKTTKNDKAYMEIRVKDTGIGIKEEDKSKLFDSFQQLDARKNRGIVGTGLGLAICKKLVDIMEGSIDVESEYGKGSVFIILLPLVEGDAARLQLDILSSLQNACNFVMVKKDTSVKILVVDDMLENLAVAEGFLELHGVDVDTALSGEETLNKVREKKYDLLFMDQMMPEMDGLDTTRYIRALAETTGEDWYTDVPVIALSANVESGAFQKFIGAGMNDSISKPIDSSMLNSKLAVWLPPEKIEFVAHPKTVYGRGEIRKDYRDDNPVFKQLETLNCIDLEDGLQHTGSVSSYLKVIRQYCLGFKKSTIGLQQTFEENDIKTYHIKVHALKGVFATLGVRKLSKWAEKLEFASADDGLAACGGFSSVCLEETMPFIKECTEFFDRLPAELKTDDTEKAVVRNAGSNITFFVQKLNELKKALETGHANLINELIDGLCKQSFDKNTDDFICELSRLSADFDYDIAVQKIKEFLYGRED
ncbi:MAG: response regulator [Spirochaetaceae bacterium]|jgi:signal transduction histidine kinase/response regulator of citrate/malate metabolism/HPt (histidine-containing phosphotransfer) domain-containing protein|nr:response regulator [Spirochaetaceae bacterium]